MVKATKTGAKKFAAKHGKGNTIGSRAQVLHGVKYKTKGGLIKSELKVNPKTGRIVEKARSEKAKKMYKANGLKPATKAQLALLRKMKH
jgi:hypothetical protein